MVEKTKCCGCSACAQICPLKCIIMREDQLGFLYPEIDNNNHCVHCGLCEKVCPVLNKGEREQAPKMCWGGHANSEIIRKASSSGGLFTLFAESVISDGGVVFGARLSRDCDAVYHDMVETSEELSALRGSKYVQSDINDCYLRAKNQLLKGRQVLFSGTQCQIDGLRLFLGKEYPNLLTVEIICHGTPSPKLYKKYIGYVENKFCDSIKHVCFRNEKGGSIFFMRIESKKGKEYRQSSISDPYFRLFLSDTCLRESCYQCPSKGLYCRADITISDFWGVDNSYPELNDGGGLSLVLLHNDKGVEAFKTILDGCTGHEVDFDKAIRGNIAFYNSYSRPVLRDNIEKEIDTVGFRAIVNKYGQKRERIIKKIGKKIISRFS